MIRPAPQTGNSIESGERAANLIEARQIFIEPQYLRHAPVQLAPDGLRFLGAVGLRRQRDAPAPDIALGNPDQVQLAAKTLHNIERRFALVPLQRGQLVPSVRYHRGPQAERRLDFIFPSESSHDHQA